jgi:predicted Rossmann-fold nucleotide-binding protein
MKTIIGIMGSGSDDASVDIANATAFAKQVAEHGWVVLTGGRPAGVMRAAHEGARPP